MQDIHSNLSPWYSFAHSNCCSRYACCARWTSGLCQKGFESFRCSIRLLGKCCSWIGLLSQSSWHRQKSHFSGTSFRLKICLLVLFEEWGSCEIELAHNYCFSSALLAASDWLGGILLVLTLLCLSHLTFNAWLSCLLSVSGSFWTASDQEWSFFLQCSSTQIHQQSSPLENCCCSVPPRAQVSVTSFLSGFWASCRRSRSRSNRQTSAFLPWCLLGLVCPILPCWSSAFEAHFSSKTAPLSVFAS